MPEGSESGGFGVVAATLFGGIEVAGYPHLEPAAEAERSPRGYVRYVVKPVHSRKERG